MTTQRTDFYQVYRRLMSAVGGGVAETFGAVFDDPRRSAGELFGAIQAADDRVCTLCAESEGGPFRPLFLSETSDLSHGDSLPDRVGPLTNIKIKYVSGDSDYKAAKFDDNLSLADIERWRANNSDIYGADHDAASSLLSGYAKIVGDEIFFTGYRAKGKVATYTRTSQDVTDGAMSSGSKTLTSATASFTSADAGGCVLVEGAGAAGVPLVSRIDTFTNSTTVVLRDANASGGAVSSKAVTVAKLQSPQNYEDAVLAFALMNLLKRGDSVEFGNIWQGAANSYRNWILSGRATLPSLEMAQA